MPRDANSTRAAKRGSCQRMYRARGAENIAFLVPSQVVKLVPAGVAAMRLAAALCPAEFATPNAKAKYIRVSSDEAPELTAFSRIQFKL